eukprot:CAMPEP_0204062840 /NCGR_PEP_ID=MMETSP0360-20130528/145163_1 /ASSEMBLY_ACC=CAM_ASM_000342 /TAXON_ID=268821 /ORGANISM="Scrippsiella Hangoei, Strain SHTV-5" /LENGTH=50 /DNA_ID=CAMNT_0051010649 /DNA_START=139 /DNA_END=287 /DNA_ORIENTATION=-
MTCNLLRSAFCAFHFATPPASATDAGSDAALGGPTSTTAAHGPGAFAMLP